MRLYIGKNHDEKDASVPVQSIFRLAGSNEDALTYALGFLLARDPALCADLVRLCTVKSVRSFKDDYSVHLQEVTDRSLGRRDIVIEAGKVRIVVEAKIGKAEPTAEQLLKYAADSEKWRKFATRVVVSLTRDKLLPATQIEIESKLPRRSKINFAAIQWHEVIELVLQHSPSNESDDVSQYLYDEFILFARRGYDMGYYDAEILIRNVNPENAKFFEQGWVYVTAPTKNTDPLYFAPYFTNQGPISGIRMISRVIDVRTLRLADALDVSDRGTEEERKQWCKGLCMLQEHAKEVGFSDNAVQVFFLGKPVEFRSSPLTKNAFNATDPPKKIPPAIPPGFSLRFDDLLPHLT